LIVAIGKKNFITADMVKDGVVIVDVGMNRETSTLTKSGYKLYGDVDFEGVCLKIIMDNPGTRRCWFNDHYRLAEKYAGFG
jgi:5,10-methylene-tetrahydrofolate dehydrogenase/methenyl tetrahydrofolate cyclohydrolase